MHRGTRRRQAGLSFVELLVTILLAGIVFAAAFPLFLGAQGKASADNMRNVALQLAQDRIEKVRQIDYDLITQVNLEDPSFASGQFGPSWTYTTASGGSRTMHVAYDVSNVPNGAADGDEDYKQVDVTVTWTAPPSPVKPVVLSTFVYKQYAGPNLMRFDIGPSTIFEDLDGVYTITSGPVVMEVRIAPEDVMAMNQGDPDEEDRGYVEFSVTSPNGTQVASGTVSTPVMGEPNLYRFTWDPTGAADGIYVFAAIAVSSSGEQGNPASIGFHVKMLQPPPPTGLAASAGDAIVYLTWATPPIGDLTGYHYEVWRSDGGDFALLADDLLTANHTDEAVVNDTTYFYKVCIVSPEGYSSAFTAEASATPTNKADDTPPTTPTDFTAVAVAETPTIRLTWTPSTDPGIPSTGVVGYVIERSPDNASWLILENGYGDADYTDPSAGWDAGWYYRVKALDANGNASGYTASIWAQTDPMPLRTLTVINSRNSDINVWVQNVATGTWYLTDGSPRASRPSATRVKKNKSEAWSDLPAGLYNVTTQEGLPPQSIDVTYSDGSVEFRP
jgi:Tfp pilus assembly protein PilE